MAIQLTEFPQFVGPSYHYKGLKADCQDSVNFESIPVESGSSPYKSMLIGTPGTKHLKFRLDGTILESIPTGVEGGVIRGMFRPAVGFGSRTIPSLVVAAGRYLWEVVPPVDGISDLRKICEISSGTSVDYTSSVDFADGGGESGSNYPPKFVVADGSFYTIVNLDDYSASTIDTTVTPNAPTKLAFLDARIYSCGTDFVSGKPQGRLYWSAINDPSSWGATDFISAAVKNDPLMSVRTVGNYLWLVGTETYEVWQTTTSSGTLYSPIRKVSGAADAVGTASADSVATIGDNIFFVGNGDVGRSRIYHGHGVKLNYISTDAIEDEISGYDTINDARGFCYSEGGLTYYVVTFPTADVTWVYNLEGKCWHKRSSYNRDGLTHKWDISNAILCDGYVIASSDRDSKLYFLGRDIYDDDGTMILRRRMAPHMVRNGKLMRHYSLTLEVDTGNGLAYGQGVEPQIMLRAYDDGGMTPRAERWKTTGRMGHYHTKVKWIGLGTAKDRVYEIKTSDPVKWSVYSARIEVAESVGGT